jgi:hypothetical protein
MLIALDDDKCISLDFYDNVFLPGDQPFIKRLHNFTPPPAVLSRPINNKIARPEGTLL